MNKQLEKFLLLLKLVYCPVAKLESVTKFFRPSSRFGISIDAINVVVRIDAFFVCVGLFRRKEKL